MQIEATNNQNIGFSYTTSSGKSLSLSMFDNQSASYSKENGSASLSLRREYGFSFTFEGSKLTQTDIAEIKDAMKNVEPLINDFLQNSKVSELNPKDFIQSAMQMADILPTPSDENKLNATMDSLVSKFDQLLKQNQSNDSTQNAKMLEAKSSSKKCLPACDSKCYNKRKNLRHKKQTPKKKRINSIPLLFMRDLPLRCA